MITLNDLQLAEIIGKEVTDNKVYWLPQDLPQVRIALRAFKMAHQSESFFIDAKMPYWLYLASCQLSRQTLFPSIRPILERAQFRKTCQQATGAGFPSARSKTTITP